MFWFALWFVVGFIMGGVFTLITLQYIMVRKMKKTFGVLGELGGTGKGKPIDLANLMPKKKLSETNLVHKDKE